MAQNEEIEEDINVTYSEGVDDVSECAPCKVILRACELAGDGEICKEYLEKVKSGKMTHEQFAKKVNKRFGAKLIQEKIGEAAKDLGVSTS